MPINVAIKIVLTVAFAKPQRAIRKPENFDGWFLMVRLALAANQRTAIAIGSAAHFSRQAATSPAVMMAENCSHTPLFSMSTDTSDTKKINNIKLPLARAAIDRPYEVN